MLRWSNTPEITQIRFAGTEKPAILRRVGLAGGEWEVVSRGRMGGGLGAPKWGVAQKLGKTRQNGAYAAIGGPPIPMHTPSPENRATARFTPFPGISASTENPDSRSATETSTDYPVPAANGSSPVQPVGAVGRLVADRRAHKPRTRRGSIAGLAGIRV